MSASGPAFSIVIPFRRGRRGVEPLRACLGSCLRQNLGAAGLEIFVVSNGRNPLRREEIADLSGPSIQLLVSARPGVNLARNLGAQQAHSPWLLFLDDDCLLPHGNYLADLARWLEGLASLGAFGGPYHSQPGASWRVRGYHHLCSAWARGDGEHAEHLLGGCFFLRRSLWEQGFTFAEEMEWGGDELQICQDLREAGHQLHWRDAAGVFHQPEVSLPAVLARAWSQGLALARHTKQPCFAGGWTRRGAMPCRPSAWAFLLLHLPIVYLAALFAKASLYCSPRISSPSAPR